MGLDDWLKDDASLESALQGLGAPTGASPIVGAEEILAHATSLLPVAFGAGAAGQAAMVGSVGKAVIGWKAAVAAVGIAGSSFVGGMAVQHQLAPVVEAPAQEQASETAREIKEVVGIEIEPALEPAIEEDIGIEGGSAPAAEGAVVAPAVLPGPGPAPVVRAEVPLPALAPVVRAEIPVAAAALPPQPAVEELPSKEAPIEEPVADEALVQQIQAWPLDSGLPPEGDLPASDSVAAEASIPEADDGDSPVEKGLAPEEEPAVAMLDELDEEPEILALDEAPKTKKKKKQRKPKRRRAKQEAKVTVERDRGAAVKKGQLGAQVFAGAMSNFRHQTPRAARVGAGGYWESDKQTYTRAGLDLTLDVYNDRGLVLVTNVGAEVGLGVADVWGRPSVNMVLTVQDQGNDPACAATGPILWEPCTAWFMGPRLRFDLSDWVWTATEYRFPIGAYAGYSYSSVGMVVGVNLPAKRR